ncbi:MAG: hypothetical protein AAF847_00100 [Bacteroidota bacterium]
MENLKIKGLIEDIKKHFNKDEVFEIGADALAASEEALQKEYDKALKRYHLIVEDHNRKREEIAAIQNEIASLEAAKDKEELKFEVIREKARAQFAELEEAKALQAEYAALREEIEGTV